MPLFEKKSNTDSAEKSRSDIIIYSLTHQEKVKETPFFIAACRYQMDVLVNFLLGFKKYIVHHINLVNFDGQTALHISSMAESLSLLNASNLVSNGAATGIVDNEGCTCLHFAASIGCVKVTKLLLGTHVPNCVDIYGYTALDYALSYCHYDCVNVLRQKFGQESKVADGEANQTSTTNSQDASMATRTIGSWVEYWCYENQDYYYYNNESQESQWEKPQVFAINDDYYKNNQNDEDDHSSASTSAGTNNITLRTPKQRKSHAAGDVTPVNHTLLSSKKGASVPREKFLKSVATTIGQQRMNQKKHGISNGSPMILVTTPSRNAHETAGLQTPSHNNGTSSRHQTSIEKEITKLMRVVHSDRSYTEDAESLQAGNEDATALALQLEKTRLEELEEKYNKNEKAISDLKNLREQQNENNPETNDNDEAQYAQLQNQMLEKRDELSSALERQKIQTKRAEEEVIKHRQAYEVAMQNILEKEEKIKELKDEISKANKKKWRATISAKTKAGKS